MAIMVKATGGGEDFVPCPQGTHLAVCCDVVDLGMVTTKYKDEEKTQHKIRLHWQTKKKMEDGRPYIATKRYTASLHEKAALRHDLEAWRGKPFIQAELDGFDLERLIGVTCQIQVLHKPRPAGGVYANVVAIMAAPEADNGKPMKLEVDPDYVRVKDREATKAVVAAQNEVPPHDDHDAPTADEDEVPF